MSEYIQVFVTVETQEDARRIGGEMVKSRLAACTQVIGPISSIYWWKGCLEEAKEWLCLLKTKKSLFELLEGEIRSLHPYEVPEIVAVELTAGSHDYFDWIGKEVRDLVRDH